MFRLLVSRKEAPLFTSLMAHITPTRAPAEASLLPTASGAVAQPEQLKPNKAAAKTINRPFTNITSSHPHSSPYRYRKSWLHQTYKESVLCCSRHLLPISGLCQGLAIPIVETSADQWRSYLSQLWTYGLGGAVFLDIILPIYPPVAGTVPTVGLITTLRKDDGLLSWEESMVQDVEGFILHNKRVMRRVLPTEAQCSMAGVIVDKRVPRPASLPALHERQWQKGASPASWLYRSDATFLVNLEK